MRRHGKTILRALSFTMLAALVGGCDDDGTSAVTDDPALLDWPAPYRAFIESVGGSRFVAVDGVDVHYVETGPVDGATVLLLHGIPTQTYLWRDVMPGLPGLRVIAPDMVGYGRSERPADLEYTPATQVEFLQGFVEALALDDIHLVVHDLGGPVGLRWAAENAASVASITMFETLWAELSGIDAIEPPFGGAGGLLDAMRSPDTGPTLVGEQNLFLTAFSDFTAGGVIESDLEVYRFPWPSAEDRVRVFLPSGPLAFPLPDDPAASAYVRFYQDFLAASDLPKLAIDVSPGALSRIRVGDVDSGVEQVPYAAATFPNTQTATLAPGGHFVQEDLGPALGRLIADFVASVDR